MDCVKKFYFKNLCFSIIEQQSWELGFCINIIYTPKVLGVINPETDLSWVLIR